MIQLHLANDIAQRGSAQVLDRCDRILHAVCVQLRIRDLKKDNCVDLHRHVILRDDGLRREIHHLLLHGDDLGNTLNEGDLKVNPCPPRLAVSAKALNDICLRLRDNFDIRHRNRNQADCDQNQNDNTDNSAGFHNYSSCI